MYRPIMLTLPTDIDPEPGEKSIPRENNSDAELKTDVKTELEEAAEEEYY